MKVIITTSGIGSRLDNLTKMTNKSLVNIGEKFVIDYIIEYYLQYKNITFIITLGYYGSFVKQYIDITYGDKINVIYVVIDKYKGAGSSLLYSLKQTEKYIDEPFIFHCCDTIITDYQVFPDQNCLYLYKYNDSTQYATVNIVKDKVIKINNKGESNFDYIYIGLSYIKDYLNFFLILKNIYEKDSNNNSLSDIHVYRKMMKENVFTYKVIENYNDIGSIKFYNNAIKKYKSKYNRIIKYDEALSFHKDKVIKFFFYSDKVKNLIKRTEYMDKKSIPKILNYSDNFIAFEFINSNPLSQIYINGLIYKLLEWGENTMWKHISLNNDYLDICKKFYYDKTIDRVKKYLNKNTSNDYELINGIKIGKIYDLFKSFNFDQLYTKKLSRFHGDFILDNLLLRESDKFCMIDWRDNFSNNYEYGDPYYDLAKLRHNIYLNHKNIEDKLYNIEQINSDECKLDIKCNYFLIEQIEDYNRFIIKYNYNLKKIKIITALIWINMAPLYEDHKLSNFLFNFGKYNLYLTLYGES